MHQMSKFRMIALDLTLNSTMRASEYVHRTSLKVISSVKTSDGTFAVSNTEIAVLWDKKNMKILDTDGQLISEVQELDEGERYTGVLKSCCITSDQMAVISRTQRQEKLSEVNLQ